MKTTWSDVAAVTLITGGVTAFLLALAAWFVVLPTVGLLYSFGVLN